MVRGVSWWLVGAGDTCMLGAEERSGGPSGIGKGMTVCNRMHQTAAVKTLHNLACSCEGPRLLPWTVPVHAFTRHIRGGTDI